MRSPLGEVRSREKNAASAGRGLLGSGPTAPGPGLFASFLKLFEDGFHGGVGRQHRRIQRFPSFFRGGGHFFLGCLHFRVFPCRLGGCLEFCLFIGCQAVVPWPPKPSPAAFSARSRRRRSCGRSRCGCRGLIGANGKRGVERGESANESDGFEIHNWRILRAGGLTMRSPRSCGDLQKCPRFFSGGRRFRISSLNPAGGRKQAKPAMPGRSGPAEISSSLPASRPRFPA